MTESIKSTTKICAYKPCSQIFHRQGYDKQWGNKKFCSSDCQHKNNAEQVCLKQKFKRTTNRHFAEQNTRLAPAIKNPAFWDRILTRNLT